MFLPRALHNRYRVGSPLPALGVCRRFSATAVGRAGTELRLGLADLAAAGVGEAQLPRLAELARRAQTAIHPHLARVIESGTEPEAQWSVEEAGQLQPLASYLRECPSLAARARVMLDLWEGLAYLHGRGLHHGCLCPGVLWAGPGGGVISDLSGAGAVAQVAGRAAVLQAATGPALQIPPAGSASPQQDVHDLAQALLWSADWPPWLEQVLQRVPAGHPSASQVAALLHRAAARNLRDAPGRAAAPDSAATLARSPATLQGASPGRARGGQVVRTVLGGVFSLAATSLALVAALAVAALIVLGPEPELRTVPNVAGMSYADAEKRLAESQLTLKLASRDYSDSVPEGNVIRTDPYTGKAVRAGREVRATVSSGRREAKVPSLTGLSLTTATEKLTALNLETGEVKRQSSDKQQDLVMAQDPAPGTIMPRSGKVNLTVSGGPDFGSLKLADGARYLFRTLSVTVPQGKELQLVTVEVRGGGMDRSFQEQLCRPGETLKVDLYGPEGARVRVKLEDERVYSERL